MANEKRWTRRLGELGVSWWCGSLIVARKQPWQWDWISAAVGFVVAALLALILYLLRDRIVRLRDAVVSRFSFVRDRLSTGVQDRYREYLDHLSEHAHLLKHHVPLSRVYVEPRLIVPPVASEGVLSEEGHDAAWRSLRMYELLHPQQTTIRIGDALKQSRRLAVLGPVGSGRTTALLHLAGQFARREGWRLGFAPPQETDAPDLAAARRVEQERLPVWVPLESLNLAPAREPGRHALLRPITDYLSTSLPVLIAAAATASVRARLISGPCLLVCDNLDMLDEEAAAQALTWLQDLSQAYPDHILIVGGTAEGYGRLIERGFAPLLLEGLNQQQVAQFIEQWRSWHEANMLSVWETERAAAQAAFEAEKKRAQREGRPLPAEADWPMPEMPAPPPNLLQFWPAGRRDRVLPLDLALVSLVWHEQSEVPPTRLMYFAQTVMSMLNRIETDLLALPHWGRVLAPLAWQMHQENRYEARRDELEKPIIDLLLQIRPELRAQVVAAGGGASPQAAAAPTDSKSGTAARQDEQPNVNRLARAALNALLKNSELLIDVGRGRVAFVHPTLRAYFAAQHAARSSLDEEMIAHVHDPRWQDTVGFYATLTTATPLVLERIKGADDAFHSNFMAAAQYLVLSSEPDKKLMGRVLGQLSQVLLDPQQPAPLRQQAATTIAYTEAKGALYLFGQAIKHANPMVRRMGVFGAGQVEDERVIAGLLQALNDADCLVRAEAVHALGQWGGEQVLDGLVQGLQDAEELPRRVAAESLALLGNEGVALLQEAVQNDDIYIRRAAIYGLGQVNEPWAMERIIQVFRQDGEWFVRSAASEVMEKAQAAAPSILPKHDLLHEPWLAAWAAQEGLPMETPETAWRILLQALQSKNSATQLAAVDLLRVYGDERAIAPLQAALSASDALVRDAAYVALRDVVCRIGSLSEQTNPVPSDTALS